MTEYDGVERSTETLRAMLDERGVEYETSDSDMRSSKFTFWQSNGIDAGWDDFENWEQPHLLIIGFTPEQAVEATLGRGECRLEEIDKDCDTASEYMLDREWCFDAVYRCSCGYTFGHVAHIRPRYCPACGRKVVDE